MLSELLQNANRALFVGHWALGGSSGTTEPQFIERRRRELTDEIREQVESRCSGAALPVTWRRNTGALQCRTTFTKTWEWARIEVGLPGIHFHDLRHTGCGRLESG